MLRAVLVLACLGALGAATVPHPQPWTGAAPAGKTAEPTTVVLPLTNFIVNGQQSFVGELSVGTPGQEMAVTLDITSRLTYVPSVNCSDPFCQSHKSYDSADSDTYVADGTPFELPYGENATGVLSRDTITLAGVSVLDQTFGEATSVYNEYTLLAPNDGTLGLGFGASTPPGATSILDAMLDQGLVSARVAGLWLGRNPDGGELTIGGLNDARRSGELSWETTLLNPDGWVVPADSVAVGETNLCTDSCYVSAATGSPYFYMSMDTAKTVNDALGGIDIGQPGVAALECTTLLTLPTLTIEMAGRTFEMGPLEYTFVLEFGSGVEMCISGFVGVPTFGNSSNTVFVGTLFMQKFYTVYDMDNARVGFADSA